MTMPSHEDRGLDSVFLIARGSTDLPAYASSVVSIAAKGSGFLVTPDLILTAAHLFDSEGKRTFDITAGSRHPMYFLRQPGGVVDLAAGIPLQNLGLPTRLLLPGKDAAKKVIETIPRPVHILGWGPDGVGGDRLLRVAEVSLVKADGLELKMHVEGPRQPRACGGDSGGLVAIPVKQGQFGLAIGVLRIGDELCDGSLVGSKAISLLRPDLSGILEEQLDETIRASAPESDDLTQRVKDGLNLQAEYASPDILGP